MFTAESLPNRLDYAAAQAKWIAFWDERNYSHAEPNDPARPQPYSIVIPPPNVTGALHMGHALNNTLQDILIRTKRMQGYSAMWMPGTDHAGIATQAVVERRLLEEEKKTRHDLGREALVARIWKWKDEYEKRILSQLKAMGCSCDWERTRFTLDEVCARAVRQTFFDFFQKGLIYRGKRLVNWDTFLQTAVSDDEVENRAVKGHFWHYRYPVIDPQPGEPEFVAIATTRPETMLGDTAVAVHPNPAAALAKAEAELIEKFEAAPAKERADIQKQIDTVRERQETMLPHLEKLRDMAVAGRKVMLPLMKREIPLIADDWARPELGSGCVKITPAHDPNDYEVWQRHKEIGAINILNTDGTLNENAGAYKGMTIPAARKKVVADLIALQLLNEDDIEDREIELPHSDRSKTPIEPYLADQWFLRMRDYDDGRPGLAQMAMDAVVDGRVKVTPERYAKGYLDWLSEKRDWPIGRQLWWGHRIPIWTVSIKPREGRVWSNDGESLTDSLIAAAKQLADFLTAAGFKDEFCISEAENYQLRCCLLSDAAGEALENLVRYRESYKPVEAPTRHQPTVMNDVPGFEGKEDVTLAAVAAKNILKVIQEDEVLDTWFSSALWPHSTLGWPEKTEALAFWYPTSVLSTGRDIITLWVARMVLTGLNNMGDVPFRQVYIHPTILDGDGERMSKSKGNGIDPIDIIAKFGADAMRFGLAQLATETQDIRMPVDFECPHCLALVKQTKSNRQLPRIDCPKCAKPFGTQWATSDADKLLARGAIVSERYELARNFCNKLWNASRFALLKFDGYEPAAIANKDLPPEDRWILSRLAEVAENVNESLEQYRFAEAARVLYAFAWDDFCDYYIEMAKLRLEDAAQRPLAQRMLANVLDHLLRLLHPMIPFITEEIWQLLGQVAPQRGLEQLHPAAKSIMIAPWPKVSSNWRDAAIEKQIGEFQQILRVVRDIRQQNDISPREKLEFSVRCDAAQAARLKSLEAYFQRLANATVTAWGPDVEAPQRAGKASIAGAEVYVDLRNFIDVAKETARLIKEADKLEKLIEAKRKKLENANFVANAPADVVQKERNSLNEWQTQLGSIRTALAELSE